MEYRIYRRASSGGYDGATAESGTYTAARYLYTTDATGVVGLFSAANLGRKDVASRVRVVADRVAPGDTYAVVNAVAGTVRKSATLLTADSDWLLLYPDDELKVTSATATVIEVVVNDLDDDQFSRWAVAGSSPNSSSSNYVEETITAAGSAITAWAGEKTVFINLAAAGDVLLPAIADVNIGDTLHLVRIGGLDPRIVPNALVTDQINGIASPVQAYYYLRNVGEAVTLTRVSGGWERRQGTNNKPGVSAAGDLGLSAQVEGIQGALQQDTAERSALLPSLADNAELAGFLLESELEDTPQILQPDGTDKINGLNAARRYFAGQPVLLVKTKLGWAMVGGFDQGEPTALDLSTTSTIPPFSGTLHISFSGGAGQTLTIPPWAKCGRQSKIVIHNRGANDVNMAPPGAELINRANSAVPVVAGGRSVFYRDTSTATPNNWVSVDSA